ncbi:MAG: FkbM family methyltransferase [Bacteroidota bacterium]|nr:FkbM family methyltransferase [Bacteroidota bacterium]
MSFSIKLGNFLYKNAFGLYKPMYTYFKNKQDDFEISLLRKYIKKGDTVLDIGANIGYYAVMLSNCVGDNGKVYCFEPDKTNFNHLEKATANYKNISILNKAVGPKTEKIKIYTSKELNVDHRTYQPEEYDKVIEIDAVSIDDYLTRGTEPIQVQKVDFVKIDIQGFEMQAIQGLKKTLENNQHIKLISEFWPYGLSKAGSSVSEYFTFLQSLQFNCYLLEKDSLSLLSVEKVKTLEGLDKKHYFNIFATREHV